MILMASHLQVFKLLEKQIEIEHFFVIAVL